MSKNNDEQTSFASKSEQNPNSSKSRNTGFGSKSFKDRSSELQQMNGTTQKPNHSAKPRTSAFGSADNSVRDFRRANNSSRPAQTTGNSTSGTSQGTGDTPTGSSPNKSGDRFAKNKAFEGKQTSSTHNRDSRDSRDNRNRRPAKEDRKPTDNFTSPRTAPHKRGGGNKTVVSPVVHESLAAPVLSPQLQFPSSRQDHSGFRGTNIRSAQTEKLKQNNKNLSSDTLKIIPIGGLMEIGKNMTALQYGNDIIIIDTGVLFPEENQPGIDAVIPDFSFILENVDKLRAIFITHGHEDHIGALPYLMKDLKKNVPIYAGPLAAELIKEKFEDRGMGNYNKQVVSVKVGQTRRAACFEVEFINVNHSIADAFALAIRTPVGLVVHSGDFKIDYTPVNGKPIDLARFAQLGQEGVLVYLGESTNVTRPGFTMSEKTVGETFAHQFSLAEGRIFVATFSSNVSRVQQIITAAEQVGRKVALVGRSMLNVFNAANRLGYLRMKHDTLIELNDVGRYQPNEVCVISTGSQGEPMSALTRMAYAEHRTLEISQGDTVIISATPIPGNEKPIFRVIDELYKRGARVVYSDIAAIHVSGHANRDEHKLIHNLLKPKYFIPIHGEYRMLYKHGELAHELGVEWKNIFILNNGDIFECNSNQARIGGYTQAEAILIDGTSSTLQDSIALQQRKDLSSDGVISVAVVLGTNYQLEAKPAILSYGALLDTSSESMTQVNTELSNFVSHFISRNQAEGGKLAALLRSRQFRVQLQNFFYSRTGRKPVTLVSVIEK